MVIVEDYKNANRIAKQYNVNCVTATNEVVYAGSYITKLGFSDTRNEKIAQYYKYKKVIDSIDALEREIAYAT